MCVCVYIYIYICTHLTTAGQSVVQSLVGAGDSLSSKIVLTVTNTGRVKSVSMLHNGDDSLESCPDWF